MKLPQQKSRNFSTYGDQLLDNDKEREFRQYHLSGDINQATVFMALTTLPLLLALGNRILQYFRGTADGEFVLRNLLLNLATVVLIFIFIFIIRSFRSVKSIEVILFIYMTLIGALLIVNQYYRPPDFVGMIYVLFILHNTFLMPVPLRIQSIPTLLFCGGMIWIILGLREPTYPSESINAIIAIGTCFLMGVIASRLLGRYRRTSYLHFIRERDTRTQLEETLATIKHLSGIVPICAHCMRIRDENDAWHSADTYIQHHSEADVSHGICPDCAKVYFPDKR
jgi:hypothetical protein